ncbi:MAG: ORF6N domain-containing protein [Steroidobacterales bacterium]
MAVNKSPSSKSASIDSVANRILVIRSQRVMLDSDLAALYGVPTKRLNEQVKRNRHRFPEDFMLRLKLSETSIANRSHFATGSSKHRDPRSPPFAFTEHGCLMLANVLKSPRAIEVSVLIVRAFVQLRGAIAANAELARRVDRLGYELGRHGHKLVAHERTITRLLEDIRRLTRFPELPSRPIGFTANLSRRKQ